MPDGGGWGDMGEYSLEECAAVAQSPPDECSNGGGFFAYREDI